MSVFLTDLIKFLFPGLSFIIIILVVGVDIPLFWLFTILCILSILPFTYLATFILKKESVARNVIRIIHIFAGGAMAPIVFGFMQGGKGLRITGHILRWAFVWNPTFTFSNGLITILIGTIQDPNESGYRLFTFEKALGDLIFSCAQFFFFFLMIMLIENRFYVNRIGRAVRMLDYMAVPGNDVENNASLILDQDVQEEEHRVASLQPSELEVRTYLLNKVYQEGGTRKHAVKDVSFGISFGECFALLGINGAGKTTTFKSLTGDVDPTSGEVHIGGYDVQNRTEYSEVRKLIGYCPQFDALFPNLTVKEHLEFYAQIKGVIPRMRRIVVERQLVEMGLEQYTDTRAGRLSGGNKRKLSVAMAMIGNPPIVFLDEPSTGMDPKAKRFMWNIIAKISTLRKKSAVILTTHSMEEAEALSTKLGIMVDGSFKCFGSAQHIKNKFGDGYEVEIKITIPTSDELAGLARQNGFDLNMLVNFGNYMNVLEAFRANYLANEIHDKGFGHHVFKEFEKGGMKVKNFIEWICIEQLGLSMLNKLAHDFGYIEMIEHYGNSYRVKLPTFEDSVGVLFGKFEEEYKQSFHVDQYSISQTTLEQIFNNFAKQQYTLAQNARVFRAQHVG